LENSNPAPPSKLSQNLISNRNRRWIKKIKEIAGRGKNVIIVVGIEHLISPSQSLPELLDREGLSVRRVTEWSEKAPTPVSGNPAGKLLTPFFGVR
jgi:uncharacterized protein YbaP (TraB family)